jgi:hypothetical protein
MSDAVSFEATRLKPGILIFGGWKSDYRDHAVHAIASSSCEILAHYIDSLRGCLHKSQDVECRPSVPGITYALYPSSPFMMLDTQCETVEADELELHESMKVFLGSEIRN